MVKHAPLVLGSQYTYADDSKTMMNLLTEERLKCWISDAVTIQPGAKHTQDCRDNSRLEEKPGEAAQPLQRTVMISVHYI